MENYLTWFFLLSIIICIMIQMNYLNKALDLFNTAIVTPIYYVGFTSFVLITTSILFDEWKHMNIQNFICNLCGLFVIIIAIFLLNAFKDLNITYNNIKQLSINNSNFQRDCNSSGDFNNFDNDNNVLELNEERGAKGPLKMTTKTWKKGCHYSNIQENTTTTKYTSFTPLDLLLARSASTFHRELFNYRETKAKPIEAVVN
ncbi:Similar to NIPA2: Magnesium transporter NIPA2 (Bos taurus) [Cotesia congregata]|uniref:Similar to NIPA2: Magnesium transporter NIPA2 (Bos taurus) n=1 Tax=Cotesia congregata TaxID=51543 RepID=A0A8J2EI15_COTCN|nr:Similar to NIPA2: Magnesium transporter NIPA2 (Bos taurus) [Cotesia congregata]